MEGLNMQKVRICPKEAELNDYLNGALSGERKAEIESHLESCSACLEKMLFAYEAVKEFGETKKSLPAGRQGKKPMKPAWKRNLWLFGAILSFALSFLVSQYFVQLLVATILMGAKWIFDSVNARILIMIYEAWKAGDEKEASGILKTLNDRLNR